MKADFSVSYLILAIAFTAASSRAGEIPIDISALVNVLWTSPFCDNSIVNGSTFPSGSQNYGGVPFDIPTNPNNYWSGSVAGNCGSGTVSLTIPVGVSGVTSVFTLLNTFRSEAGPDPYLYVTFTGSGGASATRPLVGGVNVRNYNSGGYTSTINNTSTIQVWTNGDGQRLDRQEYILPAAFASQVLTSVIITDTGSYDLSRAMLSALTVSTCSAYVAEGITISSSKIFYDPTNRIYRQNVALTNAGTMAVNGPLFFILQDLPSAVTLVNKWEATACFAPIGSRYTVPLPEGSALAPNTTVVVKLAFSDPSGATISYTPLVAGSLGGTP
ncbi:MAG TPA: hypothetical protein VMR62_39930 [Bryobacteraceae bacterium]|jgi:hypothetical protein|nr:hypothetical protein [Bryobacteraceae bacterium]